ncbi:MAG TPA: hypothetical protein VEU76_10125 [Candidatus Udaeobacter sp.]|nr:hypothetical protein [Candidatus Udaeobacter sp.]
MSDPKPAAPPDAPVDPLFSHAASPFVRTEVPSPVAFASPPDAQVVLTPAAAWSSYKTPIYFGSAILAYLMVLAGAVTLVQANPEAAWRYEVAILPVIPAGLIVWLTVRQLARMDEVQKRAQMQALGFSMAATALLTFGYGFLEAVGMPHMNPTLVLPTMAVLWAAGLTFLNLRVRLRR